VYKRTGSHLTGLQLITPESMPSIVTKMLMLALLSAVAALNPAAAVRTDAALRRPAVSPAGASMSRAGVLVAKEKPAKKEKATAKEETPKEKKPAEAKAAPAPPLQAAPPDGFEWGKTY